MSDKDDVTTEEEIEQLQLFTKDHMERISELETNYKIIEAYLGLKFPLSKNKDVKQQILELKEKMVELRELLHGHHLELDKVSNIEAVSGDILFPLLQKNIIPKKIFDNLVEKLDGKVGSARQTEKRGYFDLGMITSKDGELSEYTPSQFVKDYAKKHEYFSLFGLMGTESEVSGGEESECNALVSQRVSEPLQHPNLGDDSKQPEPYEYIVDKNAKLYPSSYPIPKKPSENELLYCKECNVFVHDNIRAGIHMICNKPLYYLRKVGGEE